MLVQVALATSTGFARGYAGSGFSLSASVVAGEGSSMQTDHASRGARFLADLPAPETVGSEAGRRAVERLNQLITTRMPALYRAMNEAGIRPDPGDPIPVPVPPGG